MPAFGLGIWRPNFNSQNSKSTPIFHFQILIQTNSNKENNLAQAQPNYWGKSLKSFISSSYFSVKRKVGSLRSGAARSGRSAADCSVVALHRLPGAKPRAVSNFNLISGLGLEIGDDFIDRLARGAGRQKSDFLGANAPGNAQQKSYGNN